MKILIVAAYFPPQNGIGGLRPYSWAKWWSKAGHDVTVLTTYKKMDSSAMFMDVSGFSVVDLPVTRYHAGVSIKDARDAANPAAEVDSSTKKDNPVVKCLKKALVRFSRETGCFGTIRFPDFHDFWAKKALEKIKSEKFDIVISTGGPYSVHRVGLGLKKKYPNIKWIVDWRDLWTRHHEFKGFFLFWPWEYLLERQFHGLANLIVTVSPPLAQILKGITKTRVEVIYNGFDFDDYRQIESIPRKNNTKFTIRFTGTYFRKFQDISPLFTAVSNLKTQGLLKPEDLIIEFAGGNSDLTNIAKEWQIIDFFAYLGYVPREKVLRLQYDADALLFIEETIDNKYKGVLTGKLFEYLYVSKEIIAIGPNENTSACDLIKETRSGICFGNDVKKIENYLVDRIIKKIPAPNNKDMDKINSFNRKTQAEKLLEYAESIG
jgi:glycosyltransferase involved in cell wall biosynthesis